ncbi:SDR family NAD(P)-dependent oxidoreductase [Bradyrhizobium ottawaense]|uniref:SDR family NAD(P)-dependent oxidoreductase n=1 Tax=Bradyrhizobium ottawaense TaxID=931866 RepID=UPI003833FFB7
MTPTDFQDRSDRRLIVISGGAKGIGRACAETFLESGWRVVILDIDREALNSFERQGRAVTIVTDITNAQSVVAAVESLSAPPQALVNAAGIFPKSSLETMDVELYRRIFDVNILGTLLLTQAVAKKMPDRGAIVNFSSVNGFIARPDQLLYSATKAAIVSLTRSMAADLASRGIRVNGVAPGPVDTEGLRAIPGRLEEAARQVPLRRVATAHEIAKLVLWLIEGEGAEFITGETIVSSGGLVMR